MVTMRLHLLSLPHTETIRAFDACAYTAKVRKFATMMHDLGHDVFLYAGEANEADCTEHVALVTRAEQAEWFPDYDPLLHVWNGFSEDSEPWRTMNRRAIREISRRAEPSDLLCLIGGIRQKLVADALDLTAVEWGIGYGGVFAENRVYESFAWMHHVAGTIGATFSPFHTVIPNFFEEAAFPPGDGSGGYLAWMGRLIANKGPQIAAQTAEALGMPLHMAGQGVVDSGDGWVEGIDVTVKGPLTHHGTLLGEDRAAFLGNAAAVFVPTTYLEPFGGVAVEAMLCGTPVITTDFGAFTETVANGVSGFRCRTPGEFMTAAHAAPSLDRGRVREHALRYTTERIGPMYENYLRKLP